MPSFEVRDNNLNVTANIHVGSRALPTLIAFEVGNKSFLWPWPNYQKI